MKVPAGDFSYTIVEIQLTLAPGHDRGQGSTGRRPERGTQGGLGGRAGRERRRVRRSSTTPRPHRGTVHVGSLRGPVILDVITRALRARGLATTLLYGVDDMDPMDAQALLSPDAIEREMGRPLAHIPDQAGDCHASYARHHAQTFIDTFAGLGIHPDATTG